jgi:hypothetical protein
VGGAPSADAFDVFGAVEVVSISGLGEPPTLALRLALAPAIGLETETLMAPVTSVGSE